MTDFPSEIWLAIISALSEPRFHAAYRLEPGCTSALVALCGVSRRFSEVVGPLLYQRVYVTPKNLGTFAHCVASGQLEHPGASEALMPSKHGRMISQLALAEFHDPLTESQLHFIITVLQSLGPTISKFLLDAPLTHQSTTTGTIQCICDAIRQLSNLTELCVTSSPLWIFDLCLMHSPGLERIAFDARSTDKIVNFLEYSRLAHQIRGPERRVVVAVGPPAIPTTTAYLLAHAIYDDAFPTQPTYVQLDGPRVEDTHPELVIAFPTCDSETYSTVFKMARAEPSTQPEARLIIKALEVEKRKTEGGSNADWFTEMLRNGMAWETEASEDWMKWRSMTKDISKT